MTHSCSDKILDEIPLYDIPNLQGPPLIFEDSLKIEEGLLFRKLTENGYSDIYGLAKFQFAQLYEAFEYDIIIIACTRGPEKLNLIITLDKKFNSVKDIYAYNARQFVVWDLEAETADPNLFCRIQLNAVSTNVSSELVSIIIQTGGTMLKINQ